MSWRAFGDWGTSNLRLYRIEGSHIAGRCEGAGIGKLVGTPEAVLRSALAKLGPDDSPSEIRLCGMAGSRAGLAEAPYVACPSSAHDWVREAVSLEFDGIPLSIAAGLACEDGSGRPDVMRGEEAQIFGAMALVPDRAVGKALYVLPGTHCKWVHAEEGSVTAFRTFLSGELFDLLQTHSTLLVPGEAGTQAEEEAGFAAGLDRAGLGEGLAASLFATRSLQLRGGQTRRWAAGFLSGLVIGDEIATMRRLTSLPDTVSLIGSPALCGRYEQALAPAGVVIDRLDGEACALRGMELLDVEYG